MTTWSDPTTKDLINYWNRRVFPNSSGFVDPEAESWVDGVDHESIDADESVDEIATLRAAAARDWRAKEGAHFEYLSIPFTYA